MIHNLIAYGGGSANGVTLTVEVESGASVIASKGSTTLTEISNGTAVFTLPEYGEWSVYATKGSDRTDCAFITIPESYNAKLAFNRSESGAHLNPNPGVSYTNGFVKLGIADIGVISKLISNNPDISSETGVVYIDYEDMHRKISVGDESFVSIKESPEAIPMLHVVNILGFNHDNLTNLNAYGNRTQSGKAGITWQFANIYDDWVKMNNSDNRERGWVNTNMRKDYLPALKLKFQAEWSAIMKVVNKDTAVITDHTEDDLFLPSETEVFGTATYSGSPEGTRYKWYADGNSTVKLFGDRVNEGWWLRSEMSGNDGRFCIVNKEGTLSNWVDSNTRDVAPAFCT